MTNTKTSARKTGLRQKSQLMSPSEIERTLVRLAYEIVEKMAGSKAWD
jgi:pyrimidine operon attenuation protein/uracil phosphoribosyltransferase